MVQSLKSQRDLSNLEQRDIQGLYKKLCSPNPYLKDGSIMQFCSDCPGILDNKVTLQLLFNVYNELKDENKTGLTYPQFIMFLSEIASIKYSDINTIRGIKDEKMSRLITLLDV